METFSNMWSIPAGGSKEDETPEETAIRELFEETGIEISNLSLQTIVESMDEIFYFYHKEIEIKIKPELNWEHTEWGYFTEDNLPQPMWPKIKEVIDRL